MTLLPMLHRAALMLSLGFFLSGCFFSPGGQADERKEPFFLKGKREQNSMNFKGALESFEKALQVNPRSASAHFELGVLYMTHERDYAAAIYHFEKHLRLRPDSPMAEVVQQRITACKLELVKSVPFATMDREVQRDLQRLTDENNALRRQVTDLQAQLASQAAQLAAPADPPPAQPQEVQGAPPRSPGPSPRPLPSPPKPDPRDSAPSPGQWRVYTVKQGDSMYRIALAHGLRQAELEAANPGINPNRIFPGQTLRIPPSR